MLPLASLAARRLGNHHHICATCRIATGNRGASYANLALRLQNGRPKYFSATSSRADDEPEPEKAGTDSKPASRRGVKGKRRPPTSSAKRDKPPKASNPPVESPSDPPEPISKKTESSRNEKVLQGALAALKNVLDAQNITVGGPAKSQPKSTGPPKKSEQKLGDEGTAAQQQAKQTKAHQSKKKKKLFDDDVLADLTRDYLQALRRALITDSPEAAVDENKNTQDTVPTEDKKVKSMTPSRKIKSVSIQKISVGEKKKTQGTVPTEKKKVKSVRKTKPISIRKSLGKKNWQGEGFPAESTGTDTPTDTPGDPSNGPKRVRKQRARVDINIEKIHSDDLHLVPIEKAQPPVPPVSYGLDRVLFNPGVYHLQDPRSRVFNFDPYLSKIMPIQEFDFNALKQYITSSKDETLINIARENNKRYTGSTSSMTAMLAHFHFLLSGWREINTEMLSKGFNISSANFTKIMTCPAAIFLHWKDGVYAIDADKEFDTANILSMLGKSMEKLLTLSKEDYERYRKVNSDQISEEERNADEAYHYTGLKDFMMRSQLDAHDHRVPGTGMFDLKTRAVISIRMDAEGFHKGLGYEIRNRFGDWCSFEREYYDMIRSAFLKYSLQVRMGRMDGIFVAFHNTQRIFGFQYIPLSEMDLSLHGTSDTTLGDHEFKLSLGLLNDIMDRASKKFPEQSLRLHFETRPSEIAPFMYIFAKPVGDEEIKAVQEATKAKIDAFERKVLGLDPADADTATSPDDKEIAQDDGLEDNVLEEDVLEEDELEEDELEEALAEPIEEHLIKGVPDAATWEDVRSKVEDAMEDDEFGVAAVREAIEDALEQSGLLEGQSPEETRSYVDSLLNALSPDATQEQSESTIADPDDAADSRDGAEELSVPNDIAGVEASDESHTASAVRGENVPEPDTTLTEEKLTETTDTAEGDEKDISAQDSRGDANTESNVASSEAVSDPTVSVLITETNSPDEPEFQSEQAVAPEKKQGDDSVESEAVESGSTVSFTSAQLEAADLKSDEQEQTEELKELSGTSSLSNLKDLIVRMAQSIDEKEVSDKDMDEDDDSKLKEFERILGKMMAGSKTASSDAGDDGDKKSRKSSTKSSASTASPEAGDEEAEVTPQGELLGMVLTIRNRVNGDYVQRPENLDKMDKWDIEYNIQEISDDRAWTLYNQLLKRRQKTLKQEGDRDAAWYEMFSGSLDKHTKAGRKFREEEEALARQRPVHVVGQEETLSYEEIFGEDISEQDTEAKREGEEGEEKEKED